MTSARCKRGAEVQWKKRANRKEEKVTRRTRNLKVVTLNARGYNDGTEHDVRKLIKSQSPDVVGILESMLREEDSGRVLGIEGYNRVEARRSDAAGDKAGGGIMVFTKEAKGVKYREKVFTIKEKANRFVSKERLWITSSPRKGLKVAFLFVYMAYQGEGDVNAEWNDRVYDVISEEIDVLRSKGFIIHMAGDMNGWVGAGEGGIPGNDPRVNANGIRFINFLQRKGMVHMNGSKVCSGLFTRHDARSSTVLDYVATHVDDLHRVTKLFVDEFGQLGGDSDHVFLITHLELGVEVEEPLIKVMKGSPGWEISEDTDWQEYKEDNDREFDMVDVSKEQDVDEFGEEVERIILSGLEKCIGRREERCKGVRKVYPPSVVKELQARAKRASEWRKIRSEVSREPVSGCRETRRKKLQEAEVTMMIQKERTCRVMEEFWNRNRTKVCKELASSSARTNKTFWQYVTNRRKSPVVFGQLENPLTGEVTSEQDGMMVVMENHILNLFKGSFEPVLGEEVVEEEVLLDKGLVPENSNYLEREFGVEEVMERIKEMKNGKARGMDNIPGEAIKNGSRRLVEAIVHLFNLVRKHGKVPEGWKSGRLVLLKKPGAPSDLGNYRPLTVIVALSGLFSRVLTERLTTVVEERGILGEVQQGFRKGRGGAENVFVVNTILQKCSAVRKKPHMAFIDIRKAYDTVVRKILWQKLILMGFGGLFVRMIQALYSGDRLVAFCNGERIREIFLRLGVRQGCGLSPILFALYLVSWGEALEASKEGFTLGDARVPALLFADDLFLCSPSAEGLRTLIDLSELEARKLKLTISVKKSMVMSCSTNTWDLHDEEGEVYASMDKIHEYKYLGVETYNTMYKVSTAKQQKCITAARRYRASCRYLSRQGPDVISLSNCSWRNVAVPAILYGTEFIMFTNATLDEMERQQARWAKETLSLPSGAPNVVAQVLMGAPTMKEVIYTKQLKYFHRLNKLPASRYAAQALIEHESGGWNSPYLHYITRIQLELNLLHLPPTSTDIERITARYFLSLTNEKINSLVSIPIRGALTQLGMARSAKEGSEWMWINRAIMGASGIKQIGTNRLWRARCPDDNSLNSELHCVAECSQTAAIRKATGLSLFFSSCSLMNISTELAYEYFITGLDSRGDEISEADYRERGRSLASIFKARMGDNWGLYLIHAETSIY